MTPNSPESPAARPARVYLIVDSSMIRGGLLRMLPTGGVEVVGSGEDPERALEDLASLEVDVVLVDLRKPTSDGFAWGLRVKELLGETAVLVVRENPGPDQVQLALRRGIDCVLAPDEDEAQLFLAIEELRAGRTYLSPRLLPFCKAQRMDLPEEPQTEAAPLSGLEVEVVRLLALGQTPPEIAELCKLEEPLARELIGELGIKLGCRSTASFARYAIRHRLLPRG
jgi:DNA-binding NarL/FixJ family response regulator